MLQGNPQKKGLCKHLFILPPKKPHSAQRRVAKIFLKKSHFETIASIPGEKHSLSQYALVLMRGGRTRDLPGVRYKLIRNVYDFKPVLGRKRARSKYGVKYPFDFRFKRIKPLIK